MYQKDKLKAMSKQVEYLILFNAIKLLSPIQLLQQYGLSFTNSYFKRLQHVLKQFVLIDQEYKNKTFIFSIKEGSEGNTRLLPHVFLAASPLVVSAYGRRRVGLRPTPKIPASREKNLWYPGYLRVGSLMLMDKIYCSSVRFVQHEKFDVQQLTVA